MTSLLLHIHIQSSLLAHDSNFLEFYFASESLKVVFNQNIVVIPTWGVWATHSKSGTKQHMVSTIRAFKKTLLFVWSPPPPPFCVIT